MIKTIKSAQRCKTCNQITKPKQYSTFCDECNKQIDWNSEKGFPFQVTIFQREGSVDKDFCSSKCMFNWLLKNVKKFLKHKDDFITLDYWNIENIKELFKWLDKKRLKNK